MTGDFYLSENQPEHISITMSSMPTASAITSASDIEAPTVSFEEILSSVKHLSVSDLVRLSKSVSLEMEKKFKVYEKTASKKGKSAKPKRVGSMPKGVLPPQFVKPNAWKSFVFADAKKNGWPSFTVPLKRKNKESGETEIDEVTFSASVKGEDGYTFDTGRAFNEKDAMSLSKIYWDNKNQCGSRKDLWERFDADFVERDVSPSSASMTASAPASASSTPATTPLVEPVSKPATMKRVSKKAVPPQ